MIEFINFIHEHVKDKHDFIIYNKESNQWIKSRFNIINMASVGDNHNLQLQQAEENLKAYNAQQKTLKNMKDQTRFESALFDQTSTLFKPITNATNES